MFEYSIYTVYSVSILYLCLSGANVLAIAMHSLGIILLSYYQSKYLVEVRESHCCCMSVHSKYLL